VDQTEGVIFKIQVISGHDIGPCSYFPTENEILLSPNARFVVTKELYYTDEGYWSVDLAESQGTMFRT